MKPHHSWCAGKCTRCLEMAGAHDARECVASEIGKKCEMNTCVLCGLVRERRRFEPGPEPGDELPIDRPVTKYRDAHGDFVQLDRVPPCVPVTVGNHASIAKAKQEAPEDAGFAASSVLDEALAATRARSTVAAPTQSALFIDPSEGA